jgi:hypothetical protein
MWGWHYSFPIVYLKQFKVDQYQIIIDRIFELSVLTHQMPVVVLKLFHLFSQPLLTIDYSSYSFKLFCKNSSIIVQIGW